MKILKFGGSSLKYASSIRQVVTIIKDKVWKDQIVIVASALYGVTDNLLRLIQGDLKKEESKMQLVYKIYDFHTTLAGELLSRSLDSFMELFDRSFNALMKEWKQLETENNVLKATDRIIAYGEKWSVLLLEHLLREENIPGRKFYADEFLLTDDRFGYANIRFHKSRKNLARIWETIREGHIPIVTGFIGRTENGDTTTLGRNGSDYSATALGVLLKADMVEIWTDSNGILSADPAIYREAVNIPALSFREAKALSKYKSNVLHPRTIEPLELTGIPLLIKNVYHPEFEGTLITSSGQRDRFHFPVISLVLEENLQKIEIWAEHIEEYEKLYEILDEVIYRLGIPELFRMERNHCEIFVPEEKKDEFILLIGSQFWQNQFYQKIRISVSDERVHFLGIIGENIAEGQKVRYFLTDLFAQNKWNVHPFQTKRKKHSLEFIMKDADPVKLMDVVHQSLFGKSTIRLFIAGATGKVGRKFLQFIRNGTYLSDRYPIKIAGLINSRKFVVDYQGIPVENAEYRLSEGETYDLNQFIHLVAQCPGKKIFVDITPAEEVARCYEKLLIHSVGIVTANKIANASSFLNYSQLHSLANQNHVPFLYETNVGSATPVIELIKNFQESSGSIAKLEATLSGTLSFIFTRLNQGKLFSEAMKEALEYGYCESNPLNDLHCIDAARKWVILMRELGYPLDFSEVERDSLIPEDIVYIGDQQLVESLRKWDDEWQARVIQARKRNHILSVIASFEQSGAGIQVKEVPADSIWNQVSFSENVFRIFIRGFEEQPITLIGAGAGTGWTAYGLLRDINRAAKILSQHILPEENLLYENWKGEEFHVADPDRKEKVA